MHYNKASTGYIPITEQDNQVYYLLGWEVWLSNSERLERSNRRVPVCVNSEWRTGSWLSFVHVRPPSALLAGAYPFAVASGHDNMTYLDRASTVDGPGRLRNSVQLEDI